LPNGQAFCFDLTYFCRVAIISVRKVVNLIYPPRESFMGLPSSASVEPSALSPLESSKQGWSECKSPSASGNRRSIPSAVVSAPTPSSFAHMAHASVAKDGTIKGSSRLTPPRKLTSTVYPMAVMVRRGVAQWKGVEDIWRNSSCTKTTIIDITRNDRKFLGCH
jgi:hypothetical protein